MSVKEILLLRHAKSDWHADYSNDHDRPLSKRGVKAAKMIGRLLTVSGQVPEIIISSSAIRAKGTAQLAASEGNWDVEHVVNETLYHAGTDELLCKIQEVCESFNRIMIVGHEPTISAATSRLISGGLFRFPTAAIARIDFDTDSWQDISSGNGQLIWFFPPKFISSI